MCIRDRHRALLAIILARTDTGIHLSRMFSALEVIRDVFFFLKNLVTELLQSTLKIHPAAYDLAKNFSIVAWIHSLCYKR